MQPELIYCEGQTYLQERRRQRRNKLLAMLVFALSCGALIGMFLAWPVFILGYCLALLGLCALARGGAA